MDNPLISVVIATHNGGGFLEPCVESVLKSAYPAFEVIVVDNASTDASIDNVRARHGSDGRVRIISNERNALFTGGYNAGFSAARGSILIALNNDTECDPAWLRAIERALRDPAVGAAQPAILVWGRSNPEIVDYAGADIDRLGFARGREAGAPGWDRARRIGDIFYAGGTAFCARREVIGKVGDFDERFGMHWEDVDLSWRIRLAGFRVVVVPDAVVYHKGSLSMRKLISRPRVSWFVRKNRMAGLIKNYSFFHALVYVPCLAALYIAAGLFESIRHLNPAFALSALGAIAWNVWNIPYLVRERRRVQKLRTIRDRDIMKLMAARVFSFI